MIADKEKAIDQFRDGKSDAHKLTNDLSNVIDKYINIFADAFLGDFKDDINIVYTGANGRREVLPHSDLDLFMLVDEKFFDGENMPDGFGDSYSMFLNAITDIKLSTSGCAGVALRTPNQCIEEMRKDQEVWTQFIDRRSSWGNTNLMQDLNDKIDVIDNEARVSFIQEKFDEYDARIHSDKGLRHSTADKGIQYDRYAVVEPNIKNGYGGLRATQTANWVMSECSKIGHNISQNPAINDEDLKASIDAYKFLLSVRCHAHDIQGKQTDNMTSKHNEVDTLLAHCQPEIAKRLGYDDVESFMKDYIRITRDNAFYTKMICAEAANTIGVKPPGDSSDITIGFDKPLQNPMQVMELFQQHANTGSSISHLAMQDIRNNLELFTPEFSKDNEANKIMVDILSHDDNKRTLHRMKNLGVLSRFIPELSEIQDLTQFNPYHAYTVDDHTVAAVGNVSSMAKGEDNEFDLASSIAHGLDKEDRATLSIALLTHDLHKASSPEDIKEFTREITQTVGSRLGLEGEKLDMAVWLAENHLLLKHTARYRDVNSTESYGDISLPSLKHLDMLRVMTAADSMALGKGRVSAHNISRTDIVYERLRQSLMGLTQKYNEQANPLPENYNAEELFIDIKGNEAIKADNLVIVTEDKPYLMENIMTALEAKECIVHNARVRTISNGSNRAMNEFVIQNKNGRPHTEAEAERIKEAITKNIMSNDRAKPAARTSKDKLIKNPKNKVFNVDTQIEFSNALSDNETMIKVTTRDRPNLLYDIACAFNDIGLNLKHANITTQGHKAINVFEVHTNDGKQVSKDQQGEILEPLSQYIDGNDMS